MEKGFKKLGRCVLALIGFAYDWTRYVKYNAWKKDLRDPTFRDYYNAKLYHTLEKSMSYKKQKDGAGIANSRLLLESLLHADYNAATFHDRIAAKVLRAFCANKGADFQTILDRVPNFQDIVADFGYRDVSSSEFSSMKLENPEQFFLGRSSLREYSEEPVNIEVVYRALKLAQKTPSSCNMQPGHTYIIRDAEKIRMSLNIQSGNKGFGHKIQGLLIVTADQQAFISSSERYQHWIDGGMYSMSVVYALHALGLASCCLNWSEDPKRDLLLRRTLGINHSHSIMMMISYGWPDAQNKVCSSPRKPVSDTFTEI